MLADNNWLTEATVTLAGRYFGAKGVACEGSRRLILYTDKYHHGCLYLALGPT